MGEADQRPRVRLVDVADRAGVTKSVASRVLNGDPTLSAREETRRRVRRAAQELGYQPHAGARALAGARTKALALLIPDLTNPTYSRIMRGAVERARQHGYVVLLAEDTPDQQADEAFAGLVGEGRVDGLLIASARPGHPLLAPGALDGVPHVFTNRAVAGSGRNITMDEAAASAAAVDHLVATGHRHIGHVAGPPDLAPSRARAGGFRAAVRRHPGLTAHLAHGEFSESGGARAAAELVARHPGLTALYASTLSQAVGVLHALHERDLAVPGRVSVITYDDMPLADYLDPPLSTVAMPLQELGACAVDALLDQLTGGAPTDILVPDRPAIVRRRSVAPPAADDQ